MVDRSAEIAALESLVNSATSSSTVGGTSVTVDLEFALKRLAALRKEDAASIAAGKIRPRLITMNLSGF